MAGKNTVTLTFAGDSTSLEKTFDRVGSGAKDMGDKVERSGRGFDRVGDSADTADTRAMGFRDTITGFQDLNRGLTGDFDSLGDRLFMIGMGFGDLASGIANFGVQFARQAAQFVANTARMVASHVASVATVIAGWVAQGVAALAAGAQMALAWLIGLGPIGLLIAAIGAIIAIFALMGVDFEDVKNAIGAGWEFIKNAAMGVFNWVKENWPLLLAIITGPIGIAVLVISRHWNTIKSAASSLFSSIKDAATGAASWVVSKFLGVVSFFQGLPGAIADAFSGVGDSIVAGIKSVWNNTVGGFGFTVPSWVPGVGGRGFHIPELHGGGIFSSGRGEGLALLRDGEGVFTPDQMAAMGRGGGVSVTVIVNGSAFDGGREIERHVRDALQRGAFAGLLR